MNIFNAYTIMSKDIGYGYPQEDIGISFCRNDEATCTDLNFSLDGCSYLGRLRRQLGPGTVIPTWDGCSIDPSHISYWQVHLAEILELLREHPKTSYGAF